MVGWLNAKRFIIVNAGLYGDMRKAINESRVSVRLKAKTKVLGVGFRVDEVGDEPWVHPGIRREIS